VGELEHIRACVLRELRLAEFINGSALLKLFMATVATPLLGCVGDSSFFLQVRWIFDLDAGFIDSSTPSGHIPSGIAVAGVLRSLMSSGEEGLDYNLTFLFEVLFAKSEDVFLFPAFPEILHVILYTPLFE